MLLVVWDFLRNCALAITKRYLLKVFRKLSNLAKCCVLYGTSREIVGWLLLKGNICLKKIDKSDKTLLVCDL